MSDRTAYFCGQWIPESQLAIPISDLGFSMGVTVTERLRTFGGKIFREQEHLARMQRSLAIVGLPTEPLASEIAGALREFLERHQSPTEPDDDWGMVAFVTPGVGDQPTVCVHGAPLPFSDWADSYSQGILTHLSNHRQVPPDCWPAELKCRSRMHYYLADREADETSPGCRALLLDQEGMVAEASTANVVLFREGEGLVTPRFGKVLQGVSVAMIQELAEQGGIPFCEADIAPQELQNADEVWLTSTSSCLLPVVACDGHPVGTGRPGAVFASFLAAWGESVGVDIEKQAKSFASRLP